MPEVESHKYCMHGSCMGACRVRGQRANLAHRWKLAEIDSSAPAALPGNLRWGGQVAHLQIFSTPMNEVAPLTLRVSDEITTTLEISLRELKWGKRLARRAKA